MRARPNLPESMNKRTWGTCRWCGEKIRNADGSINKRRLWHPACSKEFLIATRPRFARRALRIRDKKVCQACKKKCNSTDKPWEADHIKPLWKSGGDLEYFKLENLRTLCVPCHGEKTAQDMVEYRKLHPSNGKYRRISKRKRTKTLSV